MGRYSRFPPLIDELKSLSIADFKRFGYLKAGYHSGTIKWSRGGTPTGEIDVSVWFWEVTGKGKIRFSYSIKGHPYNYTVNLEAIPTHLGGGRRWYFICGQTGKRCSKLHLANGYFQHRSGIPGAMYSKQTESAKTRMIHLFVVGTFEFHKFGRRRIYYKGKPTKRYLRHRKICKGAIPWLIESGELDAKELEGVNLDALRPTTAFW